MSKMPPSLLMIVERPGEDWTPEQLTSIRAWLGEQKQRDSLISTALRRTTDKAITFTEAEAENALDDFFGHQRSRFQTDLTTAQRREVVAALVSQKQITLPEHVAEHLAREIRCYQRVLEQTVLEFLSYARASGQDLTIPLAERFIEDLWIWPIKDVCNLWNPARNKPDGFFGYVLRCFTRFLMRHGGPGTEIDPVDLTAKELLEWLSRSPDVRDPLLEKALAECAHKLRPQEALAYTLRLDEQLDYSEIAGRLDTSNVHARVILFRARKSILKCLAMKGIHK
ncbi:MAG: sigma factor-like helix-turn-helix DNA-binding protein [Acidobacteriota bacterium]